ncbi:regulatory protein RecX [Teredinibacter purpureus]|uniref:regulatory protein RecX n=1 Tax=Teredinibacter purpureus TaxID=2731756 RepID=UPI0005F7CBF8|nr:regulatory protein RecX [Teredinibacter purpureus]
MPEYPPSFDAVFEEAEKKAYHAAVVLLTRREHSKKEISVKLASKLASIACDADSVIASVVSRLAANGYLSDERFAESYCRARIQKGFGRERLEMELSEKGVGSSLISLVVEQFDTDYPAVLAKVWHKKFKNFPVDHAEKIKQQNFLRYRGFSFDEIDALFRSIS